MLTTDNLSYRSRNSIGKIAAGNFAAGNFAAFFKPPPRSRIGNPLLASLPKKPIRACNSKNHLT